MIAITMPGNTGDMLYALPAARVLCAAHNTTCDFYTAKTSEHTRSLIEYQPYVNKLIVPETYVIERRDMGTQPWLMPVLENTYTDVYHLGYRGIPDRALHQYIAAQIGLNLPLAVAYEYPDEIPAIIQPYICLAPRGKTTYEQLFHDLSIVLTNHGVGVVQIGAKGDKVGVGVDKTGLDMLDTLTILAHSAGFVGLMSAQLVLANGFPIPRIAPHDGIHWDMRHVLYTSFNSYPINPSTKDVLKLLDIS